MIHLTRRELETLNFWATGFSDKKTAEAMCISVHTAKAHGFAVRMKLGAQTRTQAVVIGVQAGIINIDL